MNDAIKEPTSQIKLYKPRRRYISFKTVLISTLVITTLVGLSWCAYGLNQWSRTWELHFQVPIQNFIRIEPRVSKSPLQLVRHAKAEVRDPKNMGTEEYISYVFGKDANLALSIAKCESGLYEYAVNKNTDNSWDFGLWQLNDKWQLKPRKLTRANAFNAHESTDITYQIYSEQKGFNAWSCYKNGGYKKFLNK